jgi:hypothetical protein
MKPTKKKNSDQIEFIINRRAPKLPLTQKHKDKTKYSRKNKDWRKDI